MDDNQKTFVEKRRSLRVDMEAERVILTWQNQHNTLKSDNGICIDLARQGALVEYSKGFNLGDLLEVTFNPGSDNENTIKGQVCRCTQCKDQSYHIAIQLI